MLWYWDGPCRIRQFSGCSGIPYHVSGFWIGFMLLEVAYGYVLPVMPSIASRHADPEEQAQLQATFIIANFIGIIVGSELHTKVYDEFETGVLAGVPFTALLGQRSSFLLLSVLLLHALLLMVCFLTIHVTHLSCVSEKRLQSAVGDSVTSSIVPLRVQCHTKQTTCAIEIGGRAC